MNYIRTTLGTNFKKDKKTLIDIFIKFFLFWIPIANPDYEDKLHLVKLWLIEFDNNGIPFREIGLDKDGNVIIAGPDKHNYGFWLDTNAQRNDFNGDEIDALEFERLWRSYYKQI